MIAYLIGQLRRTSVTTLALLCVIAISSIAMPASAQIFLGGMVPSAGDEGKKEICRDDAGEIKVITVTDCADQQAFSFPAENLRFGTDNQTVISGNGDATFNHTTTFNGPTTFNGSVSYTGSFSANGLTSTGGLTNSGGAFTNNGSTTLNGSLTVSGNNTVSMSGNRIQNVGTPTAATDAATKGYVDMAVASANGSAAQAQITANTAIANENNLGRDTAAAFGGGSTYDPTTGHLSAPSYTIGTTAYNNVGAAFTAANTSGLAYFHTNTTKADGKATGPDSTAIGPASTASGAGSFAAGNGAVASADGAVAVGQGAKATGVNAIAIGNGATATGSVAVGAGASAANGGAAYGDRSTATATNSAAFGPDATAVAANATAIGSGSLADQANTVSVGTTANLRRIVNVATGTASSDAATVGQLSAGSASVAAALGGGSVARGDGTITAPAYVLNGTTYNNVGSALSSLSDRTNGVLALAYDIRKEERRGIAAATAMATAPMPSAPGRTSWAFNTAIFHGEAAVGGSLAHRFDTKDPLALTAGFAYAPGGNNTVRVGMAGEF